LVSVRVKPAERKPRTIQPTKNYPNCFGRHGQREAPRGTETTTRVESRDFRHQHWQHPSLCLSYTACITLLPPMSYEVQRMSDTSIYLGYNFGEETTKHKQPTSTAAATRFIQPSSTTLQPQNRNVGRSIEYTYVYIYVPVHNKKYLS
jgi:hypothetical protein